MKSFVTPFAAAALALGLSACGPNASQTASDTTNATGDAVTDMGNATGDAMGSVGNATSNGLDATAAALTPTPTGADFANTAAKSDAFEIASAKLALTNGSSAEVKSFANTMIKAHTDSTAKIKKAAAGASPAITPDPTLTSDQNGDLADLRKLKGAEFDKEYIDAQVDAHEDALALMQGYANDGDVATLKTAAGEIAPVVKGHLDMARALDKD